ncbi:MAG: transcriptional regulator PpsR [Pseudomonadota bacterium]
MDSHSSPKPNDAGLSAKFHSSADLLADLEPETMGEIAAAAADVALVIEDGIVKDVALGDEALVAEKFDELWLGKPWIDTVTVESRIKIKELLTSDHNHGGERWRHVNHPSQSALDVPVRYTAVKIGEAERFIALGRDLRGMARLQQRLVEAHQELERDYVRMREAEGRYRVLFDSVSDAVLVVEPNTFTVEDANPAAVRLLTDGNLSLIGKPASDFFDKSEKLKVDETFANCLSSGSAELSELILASKRQATLIVSAFREGRDVRLIVRISNIGEDISDFSSHQALLSYLDDLPDALVLADADQRIIAANSAFGQMTQMSSDAGARGGRLQDFLGRSATDLNVLFSALKKHGVIRNFATVARDRFGSEEQVELSAVVAPSGDENIFAFSIRSVARRLPDSAKLDEQLPSSSAQFTELVGRVPLKDIVRESTVLIERLCIEAALEITDNNRASAAEMLGLSRQGLYSKLKRVGLDAGD